MSNITSQSTTRIISALQAIGNSGDDTLNGSASADTLDGGLGNDILDGKAGADKMIGGAGDDTYYVDNSGDLVTELADQGSDTVYTSLASYTLAANVESLQYTGSAAFTGVGNALNNSISGSVSLANKLDGGAGDDTLVGGSAADSLLGGAGDDGFFATFGKDTLDGGVGSDTLVSFSARLADFSVFRANATDTVLTFRGDGFGAGTVYTVRNIENFIFLDGMFTLEQVQANSASPGNDSLNGDAGSDTLDGGAGADTLVGWLGDDTYVVDNAGDVIIEDADEGDDTVQVAYAAATTYTLAANLEHAIVKSAATIAINLTGNAANNQLTGNAAVNTLIGGAGNDTLDGGAGADKLNGGIGDDVYIVDVAGDVITEGVGEGTDTVRTALSGLTLAANVENLEYTGSAAFTATGNALDNVITGGSGGNKLDGGVGNDTLNGGDGNDSLTGGLGNDEFYGGAGKDTIDGGDGSDTVQGFYAFEDYIISRPTTTDTVLVDSVTGNSTTVRNVETLVFDGVAMSLAQVQQNIASPGNESISGGSGDDSLNGGAGADTLAGGAGNDTYAIDNAGDVVQEGADAGIDLVQVGLATAVTYTLGDNFENATVTSAAAINLTGNALDNQLTGNAAINILIGGVGNDTLDGGAGADKLTGGVGNDTYVVDIAGDAITELPGEGTDSVRTTLATYTLGLNLENLKYTGAVAFTGTGNAADNAIVGGNNGNKIDGGIGNDTITGGNGADSLVGGVGDDSLVVYPFGKDTVDGGDGNDVLKGLQTFDSYTITRVSATETLLTHDSGSSVLVRNVESFEFDDVVKTLSEIRSNTASGGNDSLLGTASEDQLDGGVGVDTMIGYEGNDTYTVDNALDVIIETVDGGEVDVVNVALVAAGTYAMAANVEQAKITSAGTLAVNVTGNALDNTITGNAAANTLIGGAGNDTLIGAAGADKLTGGVGNDTYYIQDAGDVVTELVGEGTDTALVSITSYTLAANVENLNSVGSAFFTGIGNTLNNVINGGDAGSKLDGGAGNDTLIGGKGNDSLIGGLGDDRFESGGVGKDTVDGGDGSDTLVLEDGFDDYIVTRPTATDTVLTDSSGNSITVRGVESFSFNGDIKVLAQVQDNIASIGNDSLHGEAGNDMLNGGAGADTLAGGEGDDTYVVDVAGDLIIENTEAGTDLVQVAFSAAGTYVLGANVENAIVTAAAAVAANITGNTLNNELSGNAAINTLSGGAGDDTLDGGAGADKLIGGAGDDVYLVDNSADLITEAAGEGYDVVKTTAASYVLAANVEILNYIGSAAFTGTGNITDNIIIGGDFNAKLDGGAGNDTLAGGAGNDSLVGGLGNDYFTSAGGKDTIDGGDGNDELHALDTFESYTITRPTATDTVLTGADGKVITVRNVESFEFSGVTMTLAQVQDNIVSPGNDSLHGGEGSENDTLDGGIGADTLSGGKGNDTYMVDNVGDVVVEADNAGTDLVQVALAAAGTYVLGTNVENGTVTAAAAIAVNLTGNALDNKLTGNAAANTLIGGAGNDTLDGGAGADKLTGGVGNDSYIVDVAGDTITELAGEGNDTVQTALTTYLLAANVEALIYTGSALFTGTGNVLDNTITAGSGGSKIDGGAGNDKLTGGAGADSLIGGLGNDTLVSTDGKDTIDGGDGTDVLNGLSAIGNYTITRPTATDTVLTDKSGNVITVRGVESFIFNGVTKTLAEVQDNISSPGNDSLRGSSGNDSINGGLGNDTMTGGKGDDTYVAESVGDIAVEASNEGTDLVQVALTVAGTYVLGDNVENGTVTAAAAIAANITGNALDNKLTGNAAANTLLGGAGNDTLDGGAGADKLTGGVGDDTYIVDLAGDTVTELAGEGNDTVQTSLATYSLAANVETLVYTGTALFTGTGNLLDNTITVGIGGSKIDGGAGNDKLTGGVGADNLIGGLGNDTFVSAVGKDTIDGGDGTDVLQGLSAYANYTITRPTALDTLLTDKSGNVITVRGVESLVFDGVTKALAEVQDNIASPGNDNLHGGDDGDLLNGGLGNDTMAGGKGDDTYVAESVGDVVVEASNEGTDLVQVALTAAGTYVLGDNVENGTITAAATIAANITGNALDNKLVGNAAANVLIGGAGNDTLDGGLGIDKMSGGTGNDLYYVRDSGDLVTELAGEGNDVVQALVTTYTLTANVEELRYTASALFTGTGNELNNALYGGSGSNKLDGAAGNDTLYGSSAADTLLGGLGNDEIRGSGGKDSVDGGDGNDALVMAGNLSDYTIVRPTATDWTFTGNGVYAGLVLSVRNVEVLKFVDADVSLASLQLQYGAPTNDVINGTELNDTINGGLGNDTMSGGIGDDVYMLSAATDVVVEQAGAGNDTALLEFTAVATYVMAANLENAKVTAANTLAVNITGNDRDNTLTGNGAANTLRGGLGNDTLDGNLGNDTLIGGAGDDHYTINNSGVTVTELANEGTDTVHTTLAAYTLGANVERLIYEGKGDFVGTGNALNNELRYDQGSANVKFDGGTGNDLLVGGLGSDSLTGGAGDDTINASLGGHDTVDGGDGNDMVELGGAYSWHSVVFLNETDVLVTALNIGREQSVVLRNVEGFRFGAGDWSPLDWLTTGAGHPGDEVLTGSIGGNVLDGGAGADTLIGGHGADIYLIDNVNDVVVELENEGYDQVLVNLAAGSTYAVPAYVEDVVVTGHNAVNVSPGPDIDNGGFTVTGNDAANLLTGGAGADYLRGGGGADTLDGAGGIDMVAALDNVGDYTITLGDGGAFLLTSVASGVTITARNIELFQFADGMLEATQLATLVGVQPS
jgi:Ca2+-binding RTX toxin-like protein